MAQEYQYVCDGCGDVVHGKVKAAFVHKDYMQIKGQMVLQLMDVKTRYKEHIFLTRIPAEDLTFCLTPDMKCLAAFIKDKTDRFYFNKRIKLQEQAETEQLKREGISPGFTVGNKRDYKRV